MANTDFDKVFVNLEHDLSPEQLSLLRLSWMPYRYGPIPILPVPVTGGSPRRLEYFLREAGAITEWKSGRNTYYRAGDRWASRWRERKDVVNPHLMMSITGLLKVYAKIKKEIPGGLVALASARDRRTAYTCGWYHVQDWLEEGETLFPLMRMLAVAPPDGAQTVVELSWGVGSLSNRLHRFAEPGALLEQKLRMYRGLPLLRRKVEEWAEPEHALSLGAEAVLASMDRDAGFESGISSARGADRDYPVHNLVTACSAIRNFTSLTRRLLTMCGLEHSRPGRIGTSGLKNAHSFLSSLLSSWPRLAPLENPLSNCIQIAERGLLTDELSGILSNSFSFIAQALKDRAMIPDPRPEAEVGRFRENMVLRVSRGQQMAGTRHAIQVLESCLSDFLRQETPCYVAVASLVPQVADLPEVDFDSLKHVIEEVAPGVALCRVPSPAGCLVMRHHDPDRMLAVAKTLLKELDAALGRLGMRNSSRCVITYRDPSSPYSDISGIVPGLLAHDLAFREGLTLGIVVVTKEVRDKLRFTSSTVAYSAIPDFSGQGGAFMVVDRGWSTYFREGEELDHESGGR